MSLSRITCSLYDAINSIRLRFEDGLQTKEFGRNEDESHDEEPSLALKCSLDVPEDEKIIGIRIYHS